MIQNSPILRLTLLSGEYAVCRLDPEAESPEWAARRTVSFASITRTPDELSILCPAEWVPEDLPAERGWRGIKVLDAMDFSVTGVAAALSNPLADAGIPLLLVATFDTDYLFVGGDRLAAACTALTAAGHRMISVENA